MATESNNVTSNVGLNSVTTVEIFDLVESSDSQYGVILGLAIMLTALIVAIILLILAVAFVFKKRYGKIMMDSSGLTQGGVGFSVNYGRLGNYVCAWFVD